MIPFVNFQNILQLLQVFVNYIIWSQQNLNNADNDIDEIFTCAMNPTIIMSMLRIFYLVHMLLVELNGKKRYLTKPHIMMRRMNGYRVMHNDTDVWTQLESNWLNFFWLTGETPQTCKILVDSLKRNVHLFRQTGRKSVLDFRNQVLLSLIWLRRYPTLFHLSCHFGIRVAAVHRILHKMLPRLHAHLVPKYIRWHSMNHWHSLQGLIPDWPTVVGIMDCTPFRISKPKGAAQRLFYRGDRHCFFLNWLVITDIKGFIVYSRPGFLGHLADVTCYRHVNLPVLPNGLHIMADQGFVRARPLLVLPRKHRIMFPQRLRRSFRKHRSAIERCFGTLKFSYSSVGSHHFRHRHWHGPIICNLTAALFNRRKMIFDQFRSVFNIS